MGMANPMTWTMRMRCCGQFVRRSELEVDHNGAWEGNHMFTAVKCPNPYCQTNKKAVQDS